MEVSNSQPPSNKKLVALSDMLNITNGVPSRPGVVQSKLKKIPDRGRKNKGWSARRVLARISRWRQRGDLYLTTWKADCGNDKIVEMEKDVLAYLKYEMGNLTIVNFLWRFILGA